MRDNCRIEKYGWNEADRRFQASFNAGQIVTDAREFLIGCMGCVEFEGDGSGCKKMGLVKSLLEQNNKHFIPSNKH